MPAAVVMAGLGYSGALTTIGGSIATAIGATSLVGTAAATAIGAGVVSGGITAIQGGDASDVLKSAVLGGVSSYAGASIGSSVASSVSESILSSGTESLVSKSVADAMGRVAGQAASSAIVSGTSALLTGEDPVDALIKGGLGGALTSGLMETVNYAVKDVPGFGPPANAMEAAAQRAAKTALATTILSGGNVESIAPAVLNSFIGSGAEAMARGMRDLGSTTQTANDEYKAARTEFSDVLSQQEKLVAEYNQGIKPLQDQYAEIQDLSKQYEDLANKYNNYDSLFAGGVDKDGNTAPVKADLYNEAIALDSNIAKIFESYQNRQEVVLASLAPLKDQITALQDRIPDLQTNFQEKESNLTKAIDAFNAAEAENAEIAKKTLGEITTASERYRGKFGEDPTQEILNKYISSGDILDAVDFDIYKSDLNPQQRAAAEWQRYLESLENKPAELNLPGSTIDVGEYWNEYNQNLKRIMDEGGYTSQWQNVVNKDRIFVNDDGTAIGINEEGGTYSLSEDQVEEMVESALLNTQESGYFSATGGTDTAPGGYNRCGDGFHWDEARQMCIPDSDEQKESQECPDGFVFDLNTQSCVPVGSSPSRGGSGQLMPSAGNFAGAASALNFLIGPQTSDSIPASTADKPMQKSGLPIYGKMDKFEGPLEDFLEMVSEGSYVNEPAQQPQQANNMNMPTQPDRLDQPFGYFNYGQEPNIDNTLASYDQNPQNFAQANYFGQQMQAKAGGLATPLMAAGGTTRYGKYAGGGLNVIEHAGKQRLDFREGAAVTGEGDGQSDDIPAMLADGEFVFPADVVAALGNGSTKAGSDKLYDMMHAIRAHHRTGDPEDLPPPAKKSPLDYLKKPSKARG